MNKKNTFLTRREAEVMLILWDLPGKGGFTSDIREQYPEEDKPAYTTLATFLKILAAKGYVKVKKAGSQLYYTPKVSKEEYSKRYMAKICADYFEADPVKFIQFIIDENPLTDEQKQAAIAALG